MTLSTVHGDGSLGLDVQVTNFSGHPATEVAVLLLRGPDSGEPPDHPNARDFLIRDATKVSNVVAPGDTSTGHGWHIPGADVTETILLRLQYSGVLGDTIWQTYEGRRRSSDGFVLRAVERSVKVSVQGAAPLVAWRH